MNARSTVTVGVTSFTQSHEQRPVFQLIKRHTEVKAIKAVKTIKTANAISAIKTVNAIKTIIAINTSTIITRRAILA